MSTRVRALPESESLSRKVSLESRKGTEQWFRPCAISERREMTKPSADNDTLMWIPSFKREPSFRDRFCRSEPAKSIKCTFALLVYSALLHCTLSCIKA